MRFRRWAVGTARGETDSHATALSVASARAGPGWRSSVRHWRCGLREGRHAALKHGIDAEVAIQAATWQCGPRISTTKALPANVRWDSTTAGS